MPKRIVTLSIAFVAATAAAASVAPSEPLSLWYRQPAAKWEEALPVGNGRLGAMMFGGITNERIQLNEISIWAGGPSPTPKTNGPATIAKARELFFAGQYVEGEKVVQDEFLADRVEPR